MIIETINILLISLDLKYMKTINPKGIKYRRIIKAKKIIRDFIFFISGLYSANILSKNDLLNAETIATNIANPIFIICVFIIVYNVYHIIEAFIYFIKRANNFTEIKKTNISLFKEYEKEFDDKFGFVVSNNIDDLKSYNNAKSLYVFKKLEDYYNI